MLERLDPQKFLEWQAEYELEPWGDDWQQAGTIAAVVENTVAPLVAAFAGGEMPKLRRPRDYYRRKKKKRDDGPRYLTAEESLRRQRMLCGV